MALGLLLAACAEEDGSAGPADAPANTTDAAEETSGETSPPPRVDGSPDGRPDAPDRADAEPAETGERGGDEDGGDAPAQQGGVFRDATASLGIPKRGATTVSTADVDLDGRADMLVGGTQSTLVDVSGAPPPTRTQLFLNRDDGFEPANLRQNTSGEPMGGHVLASTIADLDDNGHPDIVLAYGQHMHVQVLWNEGDLEFEAETIFYIEEKMQGFVANVEVAHLDSDPHPDLHLSLQKHGGGFDDPGSEEAKEARRHLNALLLGREGRSFEDVSKDYDTVAGPPKEQTYVSTLIPQQLFGRDDVLYVCNDFGPDRAWSVKRGSGAPSFEPFAPDSSMLSDDLDTSMGIDYVFRDAEGTTLAYLSNSHRQYMIHMGPWGVSDATDLLPDSVSYAYVAWGVTFMDADNDAREELLIATGDDVIDTQTSKSRLLYLDNDGEGGFAQASASAGPHFELGSGQWYGLAQADFDRNGCPDLVATLKDVAVDTTSSGGPEGLTYHGPGIRVLMNNCPEPDNHWVGFEVPDRIGMVVRLDRQEGTPLHRVVKGTTGIASRSEARRLHFGLGEQSAPVDVTVYDRHGEEVMTEEDVAVDAYHALDLPASGAE